jgi:glutathione peroxidase-family protein
MGNSTGALGKSGQPATSVFDFEVENIEGKPVAMSDFRGKKAYLFVNVARK